jgi:hypothetical protein
VYDHKSLNTAQIWNGSFFAPYLLQRAGLVVQLGYDGKLCPFPEEKDILLTVIDVSGIHCICYQLCRCLQIGSADPIVQLMHAKWWPASMVHPQVVTTFSTLELYHSMLIQGKVNAYNFYNRLVRITDGSGALALKVKLIIMLALYIC